MSDLGGDVAGVTIRATADITREAVKLSNEVIKQLLIFLLEQAKKEQDKAGEVSLRKLIKSNDEIKMIDLDQKQLKEFNELAKKYEVTFAAVEDQGKLSIFYKQSEEERVKLILEKMLERQLEKPDVVKLEQKDQEQSGLMLIKQKLFVLKNEVGEQEDGGSKVSQEELKKLTEGKNFERKPYEVTDPKGQLEMTLIIDRNGTFERLDKQQLDERVRKILEGMKENEKLNFDVGEGNQISVERKGNVFIFSAEYNMEHNREGRANESDERQTLGEKSAGRQAKEEWESGVSNDKAPMLADKLEEIKPMVEAQMLQHAPVRHKSLDKGER